VLNSKQAAPLQLVCAQHTPLCQPPQSTRASCLLARARVSALQGGLCAALPAARTPATVLAGMPAQAAGQLRAQKFGTVRRPPPLHTHTHARPAAARHKHTQQLCWCTHHTHASRSNLGPHVPHSLGARWGLRTARHTMQSPHAHSAMRLLHPCLPCPDALLLQTGAAACLAPCGSHAHAHHTHTHNSTLARCRRALQHRTHLLAGANPKHAPPGRSSCSNSGSCARRADNRTDAHNQTHNHTRARRGPSMLRGLRGMMQAALPCLLTANRGLSDKPCAC
jgi:hypothetical protein